MPNGFSELSSSSSSTLVVVLEIPDGVEDVERIIELGLLRVVLHGEETCIAEVDPCNHSQTEDTIARRTLIDVQYQTGVKELLITNMVNQLTAPERGQRTVQHKHGKHKHGKPAYSTRTGSKNCSPQTW